MMAQIIRFPVKAHLPKRSASNFLVEVLRDADGWLVVARDHSWSFATRKEAQVEANTIAEGFGVGVLVQMGGRT